MKIKDLRQKKAEDLSKLILDFKKELFNLRFQKVANQLKNTARIREVRRSVAKVATLMNEHSQKLNRK